MKLANVEIHFMSNTSSAHLHLFIFFVLVLALVMFERPIRAKTDSKTNRFKQCSCFLSPYYAHVYVRADRLSWELTLVCLPFCMIIIQIDRINSGRWNKRNKTKENYSIELFVCYSKTNGYFGTAILWANCLGA